MAPASSTPKANPMKWPEFEQLGRDVHDHLKLALGQLLSGEDQVTGKAMSKLHRLAAWLDSPCVATVKLDGTNLGIDEHGGIFGRNHPVPKGQSYHKVEVWKLLEPYHAQTAKFREELQRVAGAENIEGAKLYGELVVNGIYDYADSGIFKEWLCFGAVLLPRVEEADAPSEDSGSEAERLREAAAGRLAAALRGAGYNACGKGALVLVSANEALMQLLAELGVPTICGRYRPNGAGSAEEWSQHEGRGDLPRFASLRALLASPWARRFLLPAAGAPLGEGLVVASEADGRLFKLKHGGENLGRVPEQLGDLVEGLRRLGAARREAALPAGLLEACETLLLVATTRPAEPERPKAPSTKAGPRTPQDPQALAAFESALTKDTALEEVFAQGKRATGQRTREIVEQVVRDLVKEGEDTSAATTRAWRMVGFMVTMRHDSWKNARGSGA